jgi:hypothetical protein
MRRKTTQQISVFKLGISKTDRDGAFLCPNCRARICPDDNSDVIYSIHDIVLTDDNLVDELVLCCHRCSSFIHLTGLSNIEKTLGPKILRTDQKQSSLYFNHI